MGDGNAGESRAAFLAVVGEQFKMIADREAGAGVRAVAWPDDYRAHLELESKTGGDGMLRLRAYFDDEGAERDGFSDKLRIDAELIDSDGSSQLIELAAPF